MSWLRDGRLAKIILGEEPTDGEVVALVLLCMSFEMQEVAGRAGGARQVNSVLAEARQGDEGSRAAVVSSALPPLLKRWAAGSLNLVLPR